jgi:hypothetical protein
MEKLPFIQYIEEDKRKYRIASSEGYNDSDGDFLIGESGGFLCNVNFTVVNSNLLRPAASYYEKYNVYIDYPEDSPPHRRFRIQEETRRELGFVARCKLLNTDKELYNRLIKEGKVDDAAKLIKPLRVTGEHYNYINYGVIRKLDPNTVHVNSNGEVTGKKIEGIPDFFGAQYWWYKVKEFARNNGFHILMGKARRGGFSYMEGCGSANTINLKKGATVIHAASDLKYLTKGRSVSRMALMQIEHYEIRTPFKRGILSRDITDIFLGFKKRDNTNDGMQSHILSLSTKENSNPEVAVGKDAEEIKCEELSTFGAFDKFMEVTEPTTRTGSVITGFIVGWGTGGSEEGNWEVFESNFYNPTGFRFMPFENIWDWDSRDRICGYFKPYVDSLQGWTIDGRASLDLDGNTDYTIATEIFLAERAKNKKEAKTIHQHIIYCGQYANMPSESFSSTTDNLFASEALNNHINSIRNNPDYKFYTDGMPSIIKGEMKFKSNIKLFDENIKSHPYIEDIVPKAGSDRYGCMRVWHFPYRDSSGKIPDIYSISYDPVGKDKDNPNSKNSNNSISVWMNPNIYFHNVVKLRVANYYGRPPTMEEADGIARDICYMYGGHPEIMLAEINRGETKSNFKKWGCTKLLAKAPIEVWDTKIKGKVPDEYGLSLGNDIRKLQGLELLKELLYTKVGEFEDGTTRYVLHLIPDIAFLTEIQKWRLDGNFDRVSDAIIEAFAHKKLLLKAASKLKQAAKTTSHILEREWA